MAKTALIQRELKRDKLVAQYAKKYEELKSIANDVQTAVIPGAGHWFAEEAPEEMVAALTPFLAP